MQAGRLETRSRRPKKVSMPTGSPRSKKSEALLHNSASVEANLNRGGVAMAIYFWSQSFVRSGLIDIDQAAPREQHFLVDLNSASWPELANLPGIGETFARSIVQYRERHGPFGSHQELMNISGIGPVKLKKLRTYLSPLPISPSPQPDSP